MFDSSSENELVYCTRQSFIWEAEREGLTIYPFQPAKRVFHVQVGEDAIRVWPTIKVLRALVEIARKAAISEHLGPHNALLSLRAERKALMSRRSVLWRVPGPIPFAGDEHRTVSLRQIFIEHGFPYQKRKTFYFVM